MEERVPRETGLRCEASTMTTPSKDLPHVVDVSHRLAEPELARILAAASGSPTRDEVSAIADRYARDATWRAQALFLDSGPIGVVGVEVIAPGYGRVRHIAIRPDARNQGFGRRLLETGRETRSLRELSAETDAGALRFYQRCGFVTRSLGDTGFGVERFECVWRTEARSGAPAIPTFGTRHRDRGVEDRFAAYALVTDPVGRYLLVRGARGLFLPGGGRHTGEAAAAAVIREVREEVGTRAVLDRYLATAIQHFQPHGAAPVRMTADFYTATLADDGAGRGEHVVLWLSLDDLSGRMYHECHEWAVGYASRDRAT